MSQQLFLRCLRTLATLRSYSDSQYITESCLNFKTRQQPRIIYQDMKKVYLLAVGTGLTLATYHHRSDLFPDLRHHLPAPIQSFVSKWIPVKNIAKDETVKSYIQFQTQANKRILYSRLHKRPLAVHQLIKKQQPEENKAGVQKQQPETQNNSVSARPQSSTVGETIQKNQSITSQNTSAASSSAESKAQSEAQDFKLSKTQLLYSNFFNYYAKELINSQLCSSVELISGPIYSKDTQFKEKKEGQQKRQSLDNVYISNVKISPSGEYLTDRFYTIVVCNNEGRPKHLNAFTMRRSYSHKTFKLTNYLTSLNKLSEQTGLGFNLEGQPLTFIDYSGINKDRSYADFESKQQDK